MKKNLYISMAAALILAGCDYNDKYFDGLDELTKPSNVIKLNYTLTEADYGTISDNKTNQAVAEEAGQGKALGYVKNDHYFTENVPAATYLPAFLASKYYTADDGSNVKVTFGYKENKSALLTDYYSIKLYEAKSKDYATIYGNDEYAPYLNASVLNKVEDLLKNEFKDPKEKDVVFIDYRVSKGSAFTDLLKNPLLWESFSDLATDALTSLKDWKTDGDWFVSSEGGTDWKVTAYDNNQYLQYSAYKTDGKCEAWLVTPEVTAGTGNKFSFDVKVGNWNADCLSVLISTDFDGSNVDAASWVNITSQFTIPSEPNKGYGDFASAGNYDLSSYNGQKIRIAFKYVGDGTKKETTTYQIDNIMIGTETPANGGLNAEPAYALKVYNNGKWANPDKNVYLLSYKDYKDMGINNLNFTSEKPAANYIPTYLSKKVAYPLDGDARVVVYRYNNGDKTSVRSDEYIYSSETTRWALNKNIINKTEQYVLKDGKWNFDPSTVITLKADKSDAESTAFYTAIVNWVKDNKSDYVTSYNNNEYYYGSSFYQNNFDFRLSKWKEYYPEKSDEEVTKLMWERLPEAFTRALASIYADADVVPGIDVIYTINFAVYEGTNPAPTYTIKYKVTGKGKFEYIADSLQKQE